MALIEGRHIQSRPQARLNGGSAERLANGLGWFSIGLGTAEVLAPEKIARLIGISSQADRRTLVRMYGLREIATGVGILTRRRPVGLMWGRVAGDLVDLATLAVVMGSKKSDRTKAAVAAATVLGVAALDVYCSQKLTQAAAGDGRMRLTKTIIIDRPAEEVFSFWKDYENFPRFVDHLQSVRKTGDKRSHWKVHTPGGMRVEWDSQIDFQASDTIAWHTLEGSDINHAGTVRFQNAIGGRGTLVRVDLEYTAPGGKPGAKFAKLFGLEPGQLVEHALRRMKQILETGDIVRSDSSIHYGPHPAVPAGKRDRSLPDVRRAPAALPQPMPAAREGNI